MADLPLIAWDEVRVGDWVMFRFKSDAAGAWRYGQRVPGNWLRYDGGCYGPALVECCAAEQQPGDLATVTAERDAWRERFAIKTVSKGWQTPEEAAALRDKVYREQGKPLKRLRDGLAALEQEMRDKAKPNSQLFAFERHYCGVLADRLAALREGR